MSALPSRNSSWSNETYFQQGIKNGSSSTTSSRCFVNDSSAIKALRVAGYSVLILISLLGNSLVVAVVYRYKKMRKKTNIFIANMAIADLIITTIYMPRLIAMYVNGITWIGGTLGLILCKIIPFLHGVSLLISILTLLLISIERLYTIVFPLKYNFASERPKTAMAAVWVVGVIARIPYFLALKTVVYKSGRIVCSSRLTRFFSEPEANHIYYWTLLVAFYALPLVLIIVSYLVIIIYLRCHTPGARLTSQQLNERRLKAIRNVVRMMIVVTVVFIACWITYFVAMLVYKKTPCALKFWRLFLAHINSVLNPCIYLCFNRDFRRGFVNILFGLFKANKTEVQVKNRTPYRNRRDLGREKAAAARERQGNVRPTKKTDVNMEMASKGNNRRAGQRKKRRFSKLNGQDTSSANDDVTDEDNIHAKSLYI